MLIGRQSNQDIIVFSSPVFDNEQKFQGLIFGAVRLDTINKVMEKFHFSETGQTYLVNREGMLLTETRFPGEVKEEETSTNFSVSINTEIFRQAIQDKSVTGSYQDYRGSTVFGDYRWVNDGKWLIIGEIEKDDVFAPFQQMLMMITGALILVLLIGLIITFGLSKRIDRIIHQVIEGAHQMEKSNYGYRIDRHLILITL